MVEENTQARVALLIDGENINAGFAGKLIVEAGRLGALAVKRVYGNVRRIPGWEAAPGMRLIHAGDGKNAADLLLTVQAMQIFYEGKASVFVISSSDGDFSHLATHLRERGATVIGAGESKAPDGFRKSCCAWIPIEGKPANVDDAITKIFEAHPNGLTIAQVNPEIRKRHPITLADVSEKSWRAYFKARTQSYKISGQGQQTRISLV
ncbi:NYN domain-containing protein [Thalassobius sp. S69A]|uniref:NYN domain-containing protein n=1 Tax=unclassified Thalassovita TaxID=2619711 RepID=UPI003C7ADA50